MDVLSHCVPVVMNAWGGKEREREGGRGRGECEGCVGEGAVSQLAS